MFLYLSFLDLDMEAAQRELEACNKIAKLMMQYRFQMFKLFPSLYTADFRIYNILSG